MEPWPVLSSLGEEKLPAGPRRTSTRKHAGRPPLFQVRISCNEVYGRLIIIKEFNCQTILSQNKQDLHLMSSELMGLSL